MRALSGTAMSGVAAVGALAVAAVVAVATDGSGSAVPQPAPHGRAEPGGTAPRGVVVDCTRRSEARFPGGFTSPRNLVVGPLALVGAGEPTSADVVREFGGNKFPLLVKAGHTVTIRIRRAARRFAGVAYGGLGKRPLPQGEIRLRHAAHTMTFVACRPGPPTEKYRPHGPSESYADGKQVTFWSGFVVMRRPGCVRLNVFVDREASPRHAAIDMDGGRCEPAR
jgi:hypothetical protein